LALAAAPMHYEPAGNAASDQALAAHFITD